MSRYKSKKGVALLLVMAVIVVVLTTVSIGATVLLNNLDTSKGRDDTNAAMVAAQAGIEKVRGYYKNNGGFFNGCSVNDCINFTTNNCSSCDTAGAMFTDGSRRYKVVVMTKNASGVSLQATGYKGLYNRVVDDGIKFSIFTCGDVFNGIIEDGEGNEYPTTEINGKCWMATSLRTKQKANGDCINGGSAPCSDALSSDDGQGRSCYDNDESKCIDEARGALYTWVAAMDGNNDEGTQGLCPLGWHVPSDKEWGDMETFLTDDKNECDPGRSPSNGNEFECISAGTKLSISSEGGTTGFEGVGTGYRDADGSSFIDQKNLSIFWTSTGNKPAISRTIDKGNLPGFGREEIESKNEYSFAIRCVKD
jgi:uncharacterized protein (TIGR02145 family)